MISSQLVSLIGLAAQEKAPPIIDFDGTILLQFLLFLVMYYVLKHLVFIPFLRMRDQREQATLGAQKDAISLSEKAHALKIVYEQEISQTRSEAERERMRLHTTYQNRAQEKLQQTQATLQTFMIHAKSEIQSQALQAKQALQAQVEVLGQAIATKILNREISE